MQAANNALPFLQCYVPLIRLLGDQLTRCSTLQQHTNPIYAVMFNFTDHGRAAAVLKNLAAQADPFAAARAAGQTSESGIRQAPSNKSRHTQRSLLLRARCLLTGIMRYCHCYC